MMWDFYFQCCKFLYCLSSKIMSLQCFYNGKSSSFRKSVFEHVECQSDKPPWGGELWHNLLLWPAQTIGSGVRRLGDRLDFVPRCCRSSVLLRSSWSIRNDTDGAESASASPR
jgi:hypothetical protein